MQLLRTMLIVFLAISIPLPSLAAAFGAPPCMEMPTGEVSEGEPSMDDHHAHVSDTEQHEECSCGQCENCAACDAPCATGGSATFNNTPMAFSLSPLKSPSAAKLPARALPAHPEDLLRPPSLIQS